MVHEELRKLANRLYASTEVGPCMNPHQVSCLHAEEQRPLTSAEKALGWARRPFTHYNHHRMCASCAVYWHVEVAAQVAERSHAASVKFKSDEKPTIKEQ